MGEKVSNQYQSSFASIVSSFPSSHPTSVDVVIVSFEKSNYKERIKGGIRKVPSLDKNKIKLKNFSINVAKKENSPSNVSDDSIVVNHSFSSTHFIQPLNLVSPTSSKSCFVLKPFVLSSNIHNLRFGYDNNFPLASSSRVLMARRPFSLIT